MLNPNSVLQGRYRIIEMIGQGGMGAVYKAIDERLGSTVALKQTFLNDEEMGRAFEREARLLANLDHPALPRVTDHFVEGDGQFLIMEFVPGDDLGRLLKRRGNAFEVERVLEWGRQILDVLEYLHQRRPPIIHRDIKPQNLKLNDSGRIILLDFGLAKGAPQLADPDASSIFGYTLNYAPLEQIQHSGTEQRSDLFSLGATLYHLVTGTAPLGSLTRAVDVVNGEPDPLISPSELNPSVPETLSRAIMEAMSLRREDRPVGARAMREAFDEAVPAESSADSPDCAFSAAPKVMTNRPVASHGALVVDPDDVPTRLMVSHDIPAVSTPDLDEIEAEKPDLQKLKWSGEEQLAFALALIVALFIFGLALSSVDFSTPAAPTPRAPTAGRPEPPAATRAPSEPRPEIPSLVSDNALVFAENGSVTMRWKPAKGAVEYKIETASPNFYRITQAAKTKKTSHTIVPLTDDAYVRLISVSDRGVEAISRWWPVWSEVPHLLLPAEQVTDGAALFRLRWIPVLKAVEYEIQIADEQRSQLWKGSTSQTSYDVNIPFGARNIRIIAIDKTGKQKPAEWTSVDSVISPSSGR